MTVLVFVAGVLAGVLTMVAVRAFTAAWRALQPLPYPAGSVAPTALLVRIRYIADPHAEDYALWDAELEEPA